MWKQVYEAASKVITFAQRLDKIEQTAKEQQRELRELTLVVQRLAFEMQRMKDQQKHTAEREANEREKFMLKVENLILKADRQLPPGKVNAEDEE
jgi:uncharacterized coiled-coil protein SlyX